MSDLDWTFFTRVPDGDITQVYPIIGGTLSYDDSRTSVRTLSGLAWLPPQVANMNLSANDLLAYLSVDCATPVLMGTFRASSVAEQKDVLTNKDGTSGDLYHIDFSDSFVRLNGSTPQPITVQIGVPPDEAMGQIAELAGLDHAFAGSTGVVSSAVTYAPFTAYSNMLTDLALQAGQRPPWADRTGVARSVQANVVQSQIVDLATLKPLQGTIVVTDNYLTAPDLVMVYDQSAPQALTATWNSPASSPGSAFARGYSIAVGLAIQGLSSTTQAFQAAQAYGEQQLARSLSVTLAPESAIVFDGPNIIGYLGSSWLVRSWSISTAPGSTLSLVAAEVIEDTS